MDFLDYCEELFSLIGKGIGNFVNFILNLPDLIYALLNTIPQPFYSILIFFISIIIFLIVAYSLARIVSIVRGG